MCALYTQYTRTHTHSRAFDAGEFSHTAAAAGVTVTTAASAKQTGRKKNCENEQKKPGDAQSIYNMKKKIGGRNEVPHTVMCTVSITGDKVLRVDESTG